MERFDVKTVLEKPEETSSAAADKLEFKKVTPADMPEIWRYLSRESGRTTDFSYGGLLMWVDLFKYEFAIFEDTLFIKGVVENDRERPAFSLPVGSLPLSASIEILRGWCRRAGIPLNLSAVPEYAVEELQELGASYVELLEDWSDYLYDAGMLATLSGKKMAKKRNHVNAFMAQHSDWSLQPLSMDNVHEALAFMDVYDLELDDSFMAREESRLSREMICLAAAGHGEMRGAVLFSAPGEVCALTVGDMKGDTLFIHIEKGTRHVAGSYEMVNKSFASLMMRENPAIQYINREDDSGDEGLRKAKESYHPVALLRKYNVIF